VTGGRYSISLDIPCPFEYPLVKRIHAFPDTNRRSIIPSDCCYNLYNRGIAFDFHILEWVKRNKYKVLGIGYQYNGPIFWKGRKIGEWRDGSKTINENILD